MPRSARIQAGSEIRGLLEQGARRRTRSLEVFCAAAPAGRSRIGLIVPRHGRRVVDRNLLKRRLREIARREILPALDARGRPTDVLIRARGRAYAEDFEALAREVREAVEALCSDGS
ncbi:MAG TPA: ribonuclease P protein component [Longimicrobiales bacterium]|nr:ribonuclease P protein component [Longimicrobiales bacterium]